MHNNSGMLTSYQIYGLARHCPEEELRIIDEFGFWNPLHTHQKESLRQARKENYVTKEPTWSIWWSQEQRCYLYRPADMKRDLMQIVVMCTFSTRIANRLGALLRVPSHHTFFARRLPNYIGQKFERLFVCVLTMRRRKNMFSLQQKILSTKKTSIGHYCASVCTFVYKLLQVPEVFAI